MSRVRSTVLVLMITALSQISLQTGLRAEPVTFQTDYSVRLVGFPVAYASFVSEVDGTAYTITGSVRTSSLSDILSKSRGTAKVSGRLAEDRLLASSFEVSYSSGKRARRTEIEFRNGNVTSTVTTPKRNRSSSPDWVALSAADLRSVLDPLSSLVFPGASKVCPRSLPIFDGQSRVTLHLAPKGKRPFQTEGFSGDAIVCSIRFEPKAGYRKSSSGIRYLSELTTMEIWFAKNEQGNLYAPVYAKIPTKIGQVIVAATRFGG